MSPLLLAACFSNTQLKYTDAGSAPSAGPSWQPGDPIPGWDDYPCEEEAPSFASFATVTLPLDTLEAAPRCLVPDQRDDCDSSEVPVHTTVHYCVPSDTGHCATGDQLEEVLIYFYGDQTNRIAPRAQGWYDFSMGSGRAGDLVFVSPTWGRWQAHDPVTVGYDNLSPDGLGCLSRVRPDEFAATAWLAFSEDYQDLLGLPEVLVFPVDIRLPDHGGVHAGYSEVPADVDALHYSYELATDYDAFWPWDDITDPDIRQQVYDRYLPYGWEGHEF